MHGYFVSGAVLMLEEMEAEGRGGGRKREENRRGKVVHARVCRGERESAERVLKNAY